LCLETGATTSAGLLASTCGVQYTRPVEAMVVLKTGTALFMYLIIMGDLLRDLGSTCGLTGFLAQRAVLLSILAIVVLLPLGMQRSFAALTPFAALGVLGVVFTATVLGTRLFQGTYESGGEFYSEAPWKPSFGVKGTYPLAIFQYTAMLSTAYIAHFNAPKFMLELKSKSAQRFAVLSFVAFLLASCVMGAVMVFGFLTFGASSQGLVLDNFAKDDALATGARAATLASVVFGYPFVLVAFRDGLIRLCLPRASSQAKSREPDMRTTRIVTALIVVTTTAAATVVDNLGLVVALVGALLATSIVYIMPTIASLKILAKQAQTESLGTTVASQYFVDWTVLILGIMFAIVGAAVTLPKL